jgi:hypothetical protein
MSSGYYASISALAEFLDEVVLGVYDKGRIKRCEAMSLHCGEGWTRRLTSRYPNNKYC